MRAGDTVTEREYNGSLSYFLLYFFFCSLEFFFTCRLCGLIIALARGMRESAAGAEQLSPRCYLYGVTVVANVTVGTIP